MSGVGEGFGLVHAPHMPVQGCADELVSSCKRLSENGEQIYIARGELTQASNPDNYRIVADRMRANAVFPTDTIGLIELSYYVPLHHRYIVHVRAMFVDTRRAAMCFSAVRRLLKNVTLPGLVQTSTRMGELGMQVNPIDPEGPVPYHDTIH